MTTEATAAAPAAAVSTTIEAPAATTAAPAPAAAATATPATPAPAAATEAPITFEPTGDSALDVALGFLGRNGFDIANPAMQAAVGGDFTLLMAQLAEKGVPGWEQHLALAKEAYERHTAKESAKTESIQSICLNATGGDAEEWSNVLGWASTNAEPEEKAAVNSALAAGGVMAEAMAAYLVAGYRGNPGTTVEGKSAVNANAAAGKASTSNGPLSPAEYAAEVGKLSQRSGGRVEGSPEYKQLQARRAAYRG